MSTGLEVGRDARKLVTVLVCDLVESTPLANRLDPETFGQVVRGFYDEVRKCVERHGGQVQRQPGDSVLAVFGLPELHEDDALRAITAAAEFRSALVSLNDRLERSLNIRLQARMGIDTGDVAVDESAVALGDTVNVAARLQQAAAPGEILIGQQTRQHVHRVATLEQVPRLLLKGKDAPVAAWRLLALDPDPRDRGRRFDVPLVGRRRDLEALHAFYLRAVDERSCHVVTVLGEAGVGKTRLVNEFVAQMSAEATVLRGRCRQYGDNLDYQPFLQVVREAAGIRSGDPPEAAVGRLGSLVEGDEVVTVRLAQMLGLHEGPGSLETASWALGHLIGKLAESQPVVLVLDDLHWASPTLLDFLEQVVDRFREASVLFVCMARSEFRHDRPRWAWTNPNATSFTLNPLDKPRMAELIGHLLGGSLDQDLHQRLVGAARGNPLVAEELVAMLVDQGTLRVRGDRWELDAKDLSELPTPPTIEALLAARLERLSPAERAVIGKAAVIGAPFRRSEVAALAGISPAVEVETIPDALLTLMRRELLQRDPAAVPGDEGYRFRHVLIRDAANRSVAKEARAEAHERLADWLEDEARSGPHQADERIARHLKAACALHEELGHVGDRTAELRRRAGEWLAAAGLRIARRGDAPGTAAQYLGDAVELLPPTHARRLQAQLQHVDARAQTALLANPSRSALEEVVGLYTETIKAARTSHDRGIELRAELGRLEVAWFSDFGELLKARRAIREAMQEFEWLRDDAGLAKAWHVKAYVYAAVGRSADGRHAAEHAVRLAERARDVLLEARSRQLLCFILDWGPMPAGEVATRVEETLDWARRQGISSVERDARNVLARARAMAGEFEEARAQISAVKRATRSSSEPLLWVADEMTEASVDMLAERFDTAQRRLRHAYDVLKSLGGQGPLAIVAVMLARAGLAQGRDDEAERLAQECADIAPDDQRDAQIKHREIRAVVLARRAAALASQGRPDEAAALAAQAEQLAREAVALSEESEQLDSRAQAYFGLTEVLGRAGRWDEAETSLEQARKLWLRKGNLVSAGKAPRLLDELRQTGSGV